MKNNDLNVFTYGYSNWKYIYNWPNNITQFFRNIKYAHQRAVKGFCDQDIWDLDNFYSELFYQSLNNLADITMGYPNTDDFADNTGYNKWKETLREIAQHFKNTQEWDDESAINKEVDVAYDEMCKYIIKTELVPTDNNCSKLVETYSDKEAYEKAKEDWLSKEADAVNFRKTEKDKALDMLKYYYFNLWD